MKGRRAIGSAQYYIFYKRLYVQKQAAGSFCKITLFGLGAFSADVN